MAQKIGSLFYEIYADSTKLDKGLKDSKTGISKLSDGFQKLTGFSLSTAGAMGLAGVALNKTVDFLKQSVNETIAYATEVDNLSRLLGINTEETSRLIQASDDLFISQETLKSGLQAATRQGIDVSIEGLKKLSQQYLALPEGVARSSFVLKTFGRSGAEMGKLMEVGADGIQSATDAIADNMVITGQSMQDLMNYKRSVDNLNDSWQGIKYSIGQELIPQLDLLMRVMTKGKDEVEVHAQAVNRLEMRISRLAGAAAMGNESAAAAMVELQAELDALNEEFYDTENAAGRVETSLYDAAAAQEILNNRLGELKTIMGGEFGNEIADYAGKVSEVKDRTKELKDKIAELEKKSYLTPEQKADLEEMQGELGLTAQKLIELKDQHELTMQTMAMNMLITKASSDGLTENEITNINNIMVAWGLWDEETARVVENINGINLDDANLEINTLKENILGIEDKTVTIKVRVDYGYEGAGWNIGKMETDAGIDINGNGIIGAATGLSMTVPPGYPNDSYMIAATSGEQVTIDRGKGSDAPVVVIDYNRMARAFAEELQKVSR